MYSYIIAHTLVVLLLVWHIYIYIYVISALVSTEWSVALLLICVNTYMPMRYNIFLKYFNALLYPNNVL